MNRTMMIALTLLLAAGAASAQPGHRYRDNPGPGGPDALIQRLELTETQVKQVEELRLAHQKAMVQIRAKLQEARLDMRSLVRAEKPDRTAIEKALRAVSDQEHQLKMARTGHWFAVNALLAPRQQELWKDHFGPPSGRGNDRPFRERGERRGSFRHHPD